MQGLFRQGKIRRRKISSGLQTPNLTLPHTHIAPRFRQMKNFGTFLIKPNISNEISPSQNYPPPALLQGIPLHRNGAHFPLGAEPSLSSDFIDKAVSLRYALAGVGQPSRRMSSKHPICTRIAPKRAGGGRWTACSGPMKRNAQICETRPSEN